MLGIEMIIMTRRSLQQRC